MFQRKRIWFSIIITALIFACSSTKYIPEGEYLLDKVIIKSDIEGYGSLQLNQYIRQKPNYSMFAVNRTLFQIYNLSGRDSTKWYNRFLKRIGEPPVIFDSTLVDKSSYILKQLFINKGYINVDVDPEIVRKKKKAKVTYNIHGNEPYKIGLYSASILDPNIKQEMGDEGEPLHPVRGESSSTRNSLIKSGMLFDRDILDAERERISSLLRNRGFYQFNKEYLKYEADSALNNNTVNINLMLGLFPKISPEGEKQYVPFKKYYIDELKIYLDSDPLTVGNINSYQHSHSISYNGYTIYYKGRRPSIRHNTLRSSSSIKPHKPYSLMEENATYSDYTSLSALSNVHIRFDEFTRNDSSFLTANLFTMPARKQIVSYSVEGTNTAGNLGVASAVTYSHRNLFRGSETFNFKVRGAYETINNFEYPYLELGTDASIHIPKIVFPWLFERVSSRARTSTEISISYNQQNRPEYNRTMFSGGLHLAFQGRERTAGRHQVDILDIDYVYLPTKNEDFMNRLPAGAQYFGYTDQFIVGTGYTYTKTTYNPMQKQRNAYTFRYQLELAGNLLYGLNKAFNADKGANGISYQVFNNYFAQFVKTDADYAKTYIIDSRNSFAWRIGGGIGYPYGNSEMLPFEKRYYSGGANSVRAWTVRELGPGCYQSGDSTTFFNQSGDIKLDVNFEYRTRFFWKLEAAAFIDAGNIWTIKEYEGQEGGQFLFSEFYKQIAVGYGLGLRLDMNFFLVRFDAGWKVYDPARRGRDAWAVLHPNLTDNWAWHIAVGYPF